MTPPKTATEPRAAAPNTAGVSTNAELSGALSAQQWRAAVAPEDFAARVVALACCVPLDVTSTPAPGSRRPTAVRRWWRRVTLGAAIAVGAGAAAALAGRSSGAVLQSVGFTPDARPVELRVRAEALVDIARGERNVGWPKVARAVLAETPPSATSSAPDVLLPVRLHVPPCSCTLSAVVCSCVE